MAVIGVNVGNFEPKSAGKSVQPPHTPNRSHVDQRAHSQLEPILQSTTSLDQTVLSLDTVFLSPQHSVVGATARSHSRTAGIDSTDSLQKHSTSRRPNFREMPALITSRHGSISSLSFPKRRITAKIAPAGPPGTRVSRKEPSRLQESVVWRSDETVEEIGSLETKQVHIVGATRSNTLPNKPKGSPAAKIVSIFSDEAISKPNATGSLLMPQRILSRQAGSAKSAEPRVSTDGDTSNRPSKTESTSIFSAESLQWLQDGIRSPSQRNPSQMTSVSKRATKTVKRTMSVRPHMPGGHHDEGLASLTSLAVRNQSQDGDSDDAIGSAWDILKSHVFWLYACTCIFQQGTAYMTNVATILLALYGQTHTQTQINDMTTTHVTYMSVFQAGAMFSFGVLSDYLESLKIEWLDRTVLMFISQLILLVPVAILSWHTPSDGMLLFCSICTGLGFGASSCLLPILTQDFFGLQFFVE
ncbi:hypothetical protein HDU98_007039 [Podochytrium sp. JEL0797]|nr:hypothetical protein HDU98_007039 [Podochytrium sp. JEL0797]